MPDSSSEYSGLVSDYTKFMLLRIAVFATVVISVFSGTTQIRSFSPVTIDTVKAIKHIIGTSPKDQDDLVELVFFTNRKDKKNDGDVATFADTQLVNNIIQAKYPALSMANLIGFRDTTVMLDNYLQATMDGVYGKLKAMSDKAFIIKLSILPDVTFDLRYWVFILPILFAVAAIYSSILKFRIQFTQLDDERNNTVKNLVQRQFPYLYLRGLFELANFFLIVFFLGDVYSILANFPPEAIYYLSIFYTLTLCYSAAYIGTAHRKIFIGYQGEQTLFINKAWDYSIAKTRQFVLWVRYSRICYTAASLLALTLFLSMSYETCTSGNDKPKTLKGYKLILDYKKSIWQFGEDLSMPSFCRFYQVCYISLFVMTIIFLFLIVKKGKYKSLVGQKILMVYYSAVLMVFSMYFVFGNGFYPETLVFAQAVLLLFLWIQKNYFTSFRKANWNYAKLAGTLVLYCLPLIPFSFYQLFMQLSLVPGWTVLYICIMSLTICAYFFYREQANSRKTTTVKIE